MAGPRFPLTDRELVHLPSPKERANLRATLQALQTRLTGKTTPEAEHFEIDGILKETLYGAGAPSLAEVLDALKKAVNGTDRTVYEVMQLAKDESNVDYDEIVDFILDAIKIRGGANT